MRLCKPTRARHDNLSKPTVGTQAWETIMEAIKVIGGRKDTYIQEKNYQLCNVCHFIVI